MQNYPPPGFPNFADNGGQTSYATVGRYNLRCLSIACRHVAGDAGCTVAALGRATVDVHNATVRNPQASGPAAGLLQQTLNGFQANFNSIALQQQQNNAKWAQLSTQLHDLRCMGVHAFNRSSKVPSDSIRALPPAAGQPPPAAFPSTRSDLSNLSSATATTFLNAYNQPTGGTRREKINRLARHIGVGDLL
eukprot:CAMPEP_0202889854 /NCGR_PEP_ID=MMETSP1392-20130828/412_1 /ASSEMBLY_ACC=CAM_ASM_000868 /TAXON_ID=225041 /ORGANISM="Chlamydomonas chlamydogama, Strain SAG 11-48b" /LENGTH=191 /DNA_ID=CAMNT_0049573283 /DNA_START=106 /DNA_END=681 /DNA_ORIENTATION=+